MTFLHPLLLSGLAGMAVPILVHLLGRRRARRVLFPSLRLLQAAQKKRRSLSRLQRLLALLVRMLAVALLALGLAGPVIGPVPAWLPLPRPQATALVLDDSLSMAYSPGARAGASCFEAARSSAEQLLAAFRPGDRVALIRASAPGEVVWRSPSAARQHLAAAQTTALGAKLAPALLAAGRALREAAAPNRSVVLLTDLQAAAWRRPPVDGAEVAPARVVVVGVGGDRAENLSVNSFDCLTAAPLVGRPLRLEATVGLSGSGKPAAPNRRVVAQLAVSGKTAAASEVVVAAGAEAAVQFGLLPDAAGDLPARVTLAEARDGLRPDDVRYATVRVRPALRVLIAAPGGAGRGPGFYLAAALNPFGAAARAGIAPEAVEPSALAAALASAPRDLVILADCARPDAETVRALGDHMAAGGGVFLFLGDDVDPGFYSRQLLPALTGDSAVTVGEVRKAPADTPFSLAEINTSHEPLSAFANPRAGDLGALRFTRHRAVRAGPAAEVLAAFDDGTPALLEWRPGHGRVMLFNTSADASWGEHLRSPAYVPLLHRLSYRLARPARPAIADLLAGERPEITGTPDLPRRVTLIAPDGKAQAVSVEDGRLPEVNETGSYRAQWERQDVGFAVNVEPQESDLTRTTEAAVRKALAPAEVTSVPPGAVAELRAQLPARSDLSLPLLLLALAVILVESVWSLISLASAEPQPSP